MESPFAKRKAAFRELILGFVLGRRMLEPRTRRLDIPSRVRDHGSLIARLIVTVQDDARLQTPRHVFGSRALFPVTLV
jgi:hypothetical protein